MNLQHILAAADESDAGREALRAAIDLAARARARLTAMRVVAVKAMTVPPIATDVLDMFGRMRESSAAQSLHQWLGTDLRRHHEPPQAAVGIASGIPAVEICRSVERRQADLVVLGRKQRSQWQRLLLGDTADAVARRSVVPCLFVPPDTGPLRRLLVALDGSDRGMAVLKEASGFARAAGAGMQMVTVETGPDDEPGVLASALPVGRSTRLQSQWHALRAREPGAEAVPVLEVRRGAIVEEILAAVDASGPDVLVVGYHRGLLGLSKTGSTARHLVHTAPCAVLTISV